MHDEDVTFVWLQNIGNTIYIEIVCVWSYAPNTNVVTAFAFRLVIKHKKGNFKIWETARVVFSLKYENTSQTLLLVKMT